MKRFLKRLFRWTLILIGLVLTAGFVFLQCSPQFGGSATDAQRQEYAKTGHYADGIFLNDEVIEMEINCHSVTQMVKELINPHPNVAPERNITVLKIPAPFFREAPDSVNTVTWFGHSTFLIQLEGKTILLDPVFGQYAAPLPFGRKRFHKEMPLDLEELPELDLVVISHDHYDHLEYKSIKALRAKTKQFWVPLGVGNHLRAWDVPETQIREFDWWQEGQYEDLTVALTPSRHMSGRGLTDQSATLWGSWVFLGTNTRIYFSGDGGYGKHFLEIGQKYGPFDIGLMECGQYNKLWADVHMMPEQTVQAASDIRADLVVPIHWAAFALAAHSWTDPIERVVQEAARVQLPLATPQIGEPVVVGASTYPDSHWWEVY
ncbi:MAG: hypothetical protein F6K11_01145 [Leptolyngbya sp. SIO3F4]|nr:hypothetical protein [Leptolyngbya sp. SIO3F4]